jgi:hypothetical protein
MATPIHITITMYTYNFKVRKLTGWVVRTSINEGFSSPPTKENIRTATGVNALSIYCTIDQKKDRMRCRMQYLNVGNWQEDVGFIWQNQTKCKEYWNRKNLCLNHGSVDFFLQSNNDTMVFSLKVNLSDSRKHICCSFHYLSKNCCEDHVPRR